MPLMVQPDMPAKACHGSISAKSKLGAGTEFTIKFPENE